MALPPEPLEEVLPRASLVVDAEVTEILATGPRLPVSTAEAGATSAGRKAPSQIVRLRVDRTMKGKLIGTDLVVEKPVAGYALRPGNKGPFLIDMKTTPKPQILGRYGPDTWSMAKIEQALAD